MAEDEIPEIPLDLRPGDLGRPWSVEEGDTIHTAQLSSRELLRFDPPWVSHGKLTTLREIMAEVEAAGGRVIRVAPDRAGDETLVIGGSGVTADEVLVKNTAGMTAEEAGRYQASAGFFYDCVEAGVEFETRPWPEGVRLGTAAEAEARLAEMIVAPLQDRDAPPGDRIAVDWSSRDPEFDAIGAHVSEPWTAERPGVSSRLLSVVLVVAVVETVILGVLLGLWWAGVFS